jgi:hypothetical protein
VGGFYLGGILSHNIKQFVIISIANIIADIFSNTKQIFRGPDDGIIKPRLPIKNFIWFFPLISKQTRPLYQRIILDNVNG